jgi:uncharacterized damage-inducible protein DinB
MCARRAKAKGVYFPRMARGQRLADALERTVSGPMWHGPALADLIGDVTADAAAARPIAGAHSIWELVHHITAWAEIARLRLTSAVKPPDATDEQDWPPVRDRSAEAWRAAVERLKDAHRELAEAVSACDDARLGERLPGRDHSATVMLHGIMEHGAYHGGQIAILKRALARQPSSP